MSLALAIGLPVAAYLVGSIPFGVVLARGRGVDLRRVGSGNIGATNAARALGKATGGLVLLLDAVKGLVPTLTARLVVPDGPWRDHLIAATALAAFLGHLFPLYLKLRGGKGVATALGVFLAVSPWAALGAGAFYAATYATTRISSLGSLCGTLASVPLIYFVSGRNTVYTGLAGIIFIAIVISHRQNIRRLLTRQEGKV